MMDEGEGEASDQSPDASSCDSDDDRFYILRLKIMQNLKRHRLALHREEMALSCQVKSLRQTLNGSSRLVDELEDANRAWAEREDIIGAQDTDLIKLNQENQALKARRDNIHSEPQVDKDYRAFFDKNSQDMHEKLMIIEYLQSSTEAHLTTIQELRTKKKDLEVRLEKAMAFGEPKVDQPISKAGEQGQLPPSHVEVSIVEEAQEGKPHRSLDVQTKSWWRRQADKAVRSMRTFRLDFRCCLGTRRRRVVQPGNTNMDIDLPSVSVGMPPVSV